LYSSKAWANEHILLLIFSFPIDEFCSKPKLIEYVYYLVSCLDFFFEVLLISVQRGQCFIVSGVDIWGSLLAFALAFLAEGIKILSCFLEAVVETHVPV
jgi:hypothetical protein